VADREAANSAKNARPLRPVRADSGRSAEGGGDPVKARPNPTRRPRPARTSPAASPTGTAATRATATRTTAPRAAAPRTAAPRTAGPRTAAAGSSSRRRTTVLPPVMAHEAPADDARVAPAQVDLTGAEPGVEKNTGVEENTGVDESIGFNEDTDLDAHLADWLAEEELVSVVTKRDLRRAGSRRRVAAALAVVAVLLGAIGYLAWRLQDANSQLSAYRALDAQRAVVLKTASQAAVDMTTYNYQHLPVFFSTIEAESTPNYIAVVEKDKSLLTEAFTQGHATSTATVVGSGISSMTATRAVVVLFVDQTVTNTLSKTPTKDLSRVQLTLVRQGSTWRVDGVQLP
jgi:Mce-associated membrane protein